MKNNIKLNLVILIFGPTGVGKSYLAIKLAQKYNGIIINADSMQVYDVLRILTARPNFNEMFGIKHYLYGFLHPSNMFSVGHWLKIVSSLFRNSFLQNKTWIFVGGTGLYIRSLTSGLTKFPPIDIKIREKFRFILKMYGIKSIYQILLKKDILTAKKISPNDKNRILRALEIIESTGVSILEWQKKEKESILKSNKIIKIAITPSIKNIELSINDRIKKMINKGVIEEIKEIKSMNLNPELPSMKAIGIHDFFDYLNSKISLEEAIKKLQRKTLRYSKRQITWIRHQMRENWNIFPNIEEAMKFKIDYNF